MMVFFESIMLRCGDIEMNIPVLTGYHDFKSTEFPFPNGHSHEPLPLYDDLYFPKSQVT